MGEVVDGVRAVQAAGFSGPALDFGPDGVEGVVAVAVGQQVEVKKLALLLFPWAHEHDRLGRTPCLA